MLQGDNVIRREYVDTSKVARCASMQRPSLKSMTMFGSIVSLSVRDLVCALDPQTERENTVSIAHPLILSDTESTCYCDA